MKSRLLAAAALAAVGACTSHVLQPQGARGALHNAAALEAPLAPARPRPGDDFYAYANGEWHPSFEIPADRGSYGVFNELDELSKRRVKDIIEEAAAAGAPAGSAQQRIGDYYASFMDTAAIEGQGLVPIREDLTRIEAASSKKDIATLFGLPGFASTFSIQLPPDLKNPDRYSVEIDQAGLGLPDRNYYLQADPKLEEIRTRYVAYIGEILTLGGLPDAEAKARAIMDFETQLARAQWPIERIREVETNYNPRTKRQLLAYAPGFDWQAFLAAAGIGDRRDLLVGQLTAVRDIAELIARTPLPVLKDYMTFHHLSDNALYLPQRFDDANFAFFGRYLRGQPTERERWKRAVEQVNAALGEQVGVAYVARYFPAQSKAKMQSLVASLRAALRQRIEELTWMTPQTKQRAQEKLAMLATKIGYPDKWKDYSGLEVRRDDLMGNVRRATQWEWNRQVARLDQPVDRGEWQLDPQDINAYYNAQNNEIVFPAGILQPPFFDPDADAAVNYGAVGAVIGHEISHGFDDQGRKFGPDGSLKDWWTAADSAAFQERATQLVQQFSQFDALPGLKVNGASTLGENIGDLGGLNMAFSAYEISLHGEPAVEVAGVTGEQRFFLSWARLWRTLYREGALREEVLSDVHSPAYFRVNGSVRNMPPWYAAFGVQPGDKLYLEPSQRVSIW